MDEELTARQVPQSLEAEQAVLGSILIDSRCITDVVGVVKPEDFYLQQNREIYETIYTMFNFSQTIDPVTVLDKMSWVSTTTIPGNISFNSWKSPLPLSTWGAMPESSRKRPCSGDWDRPPRILRKWFPIR